MALEWWRRLASTIAGLGTGSAVNPLLKKVKPVFGYPALVASILAPYAAIREGITPALAAAGGALASTPLVYLGARMEKPLAAWVAKRPMFFTRFLRLANAGATLLAPFIVASYMKSFLTGEKKK